MLPCVVAVGCVADTSFNRCQNNSATYSANAEWNMSCESVKISLDSMTFIMSRLMRKPPRRADQRLKRILRKIKYTSGGRRTPNTAAKHAVNAHMMPFTR